VYNNKRKRNAMEKNEIKRELNKLNEKVLDLWRSL